MSIERLNLNLIRNETGDPYFLVQTELYLEEITDNIEESEVTCQTDAWMDRPVTPLFVPAKTGADVETQIMPGDLFNFDQEVKVRITER